MRNAGENSNSMGAQSNTNTNTNNNSNSKTLFESFTFEQVQLQPRDFDVEQEAVDEFRRGGPHAKNNNAKNYESIEFFNIYSPLVRSTSVSVEQQKRRMASMERSLASGTGTGTLASTQCAESGVGGSGFGGDGMAQFFHEVNKRVESHPEYISSIARADRDQKEKSEVIAGNSRSNSPKHNNDKLGGGGNGIPIGVTSLNSLHSAPVTSHISSQCSLYNDDRYPVPGVDAAQYRPSTSFQSANQPQYDEMSEIQRLKDSVINMGSPTAVTSPKKEELKLVSGTGESSSTKPTPIKQVVKPSESANGSKAPASSSDHQTTSSEDANDLSFVLSNEQLAEINPRAAALHPTRSKGEKLDIRVRGLRSSSNSMEQELYLEQQEYRSGRYLDRRYGAGGYPGRDEGSEEEDEYYMHNPQEDNRCGQLADLTLTQYPMTQYSYDKEFNFKLEDVEALEETFKDDAAEEREMEARALRRFQDDVEKSK